MEKERGFNFRLLLPPRMNTGQVSAVRPQENIENSGDLINTLQQSYSKCFNKEKSIPFPTEGMVAAAKPTRQDITKMKVLPLMEKDENNCNPGQIYSKLFDEVDKIKCWKVKVDTDTLQKERKLQENKRTIETQRKAIQELQFGNESLSVKLEEQISENEDLKNKNNATRNLCNILKDTFQRTAEKTHLFESEREETHHLFIENGESIQKLTAAFENLRVQAEANEQEIQKVKDGFLQFEDLKEKYKQEYDMKEKEVAVLQTKLKEKENELQKTLHDLHETQKHCQQFEDTTKKQNELLKSSKTEQESLLQELHSAEQRCKETEKNREVIASMLKQSKEEYAEMVQSKDLKLEELNRVKDQQAEKVTQLQTTILELQNSITLEIQRVHNLEEKLMASNKELERRNTLLGETMEQSVGKDGQIKLLEEELDKKSKSIESMKGKVGVTESRVDELKAELSRKTMEAQLLKNEVGVASAENDLLKKACEAAEKAKEDSVEISTVKEIKVQELQGQLLSEKKKNEQHTIQMELLRRDITQNEVKYKELLSSFNALQSEKTAIQQQFQSGSSNVKTLEANVKVSEEKAVKLTREIQRLEEENQCLREEVNSMKTKIQGKYEEAETLKTKIEESCEHLQEEIEEKEKQIKSLETKLCNLRRKIDNKLSIQEEYQKENKVLKKQIAKETAKSSQLETVISSLHKEAQNLKRLNEEDHQKLLKDLESASTLAAELRNEVQHLKATTAEAVKNKEDADLKCQRKIADMVALMEKHKNHYERMVNEKDAELVENQKKEMEAVAKRNSLELDLQEQKTDNDQLKQQLKAEVTKKESLQKELTDLKKEMSSVKITQLSDVMLEQSPDSNCKRVRCSETPNESSSKRHVFDFSKIKKTPSSSKNDGRAVAVKKTEIHNEDPKTPREITNRFGGSSKIKSYRIRTPPSPLTASWRKNVIELDPKSDSPEDDLLSFVSESVPSFSAPHGKLHILQKSPVNRKSPGNSLKLAAIKRMRDAGWTAVTGCDKKKKKGIEKIFA